MSTLNRLQSPPFRDIKDINLIEPEKTYLGNALPVYYIHSEQSELLRIEFSFPAGEKYQSVPLLAKTANQLINNGTSTRTAASIAEEIDRYGAFLETEVTKDNASLLVYTLHKYLDKILPIMKELMMDATYPEKEISTFLQNSRQSYLVNLEKVSFLAREEFRKLLFGVEHPYGMPVEISDFDTIKRTDVLNYYRDRYSLNNCKIMLAGKIDQGTLEIFEKAFGDWPFTPSQRDEGALRSILPHAPSRQHISKEGAVQSAIRIGKPLFTKSHPDYCAMVVLNTIFGGYFGSRLMSNIREDKGYTYGIRSGLVSLQDAGYFIISTEVGSHVCDQAVEEIYKEIDRLRVEPVPQQELELVKNYMLGSLLRSFDGAFAQIERFIAVDELGLNMEFYHRYAATIRSMHAEKIMELANQYLGKDSFIELTVGEDNK